MFTSLQQSSPEMLARHFKHFATREFPGNSPLYQQLSLAISNDAEMLALAAHATSRPVPNLFLGAVHFLLLRGEQGGGKPGPYYTRARCPVYSRGRACPRPAPLATAGNVPHPKTG